jgi:hypothetical protein
MKTTTCKECNGFGEHDHLRNCGKPPQYCCGGCYDTYDCEECNGSGEVIEEEEE